MSAAHGLATALTLTGLNVELALDGPAGKTRTVDLKQPSARANGCNASGANFWACGRTFRSSGVDAWATSHSPECGRLSLTRWPPAHALGCCFKSTVRVCKSPK
jgi:hypothetical protein